MLLYQKAGCVYGIKCFGANTRAPLYNLIEELANQPLSRDPRFAVEVELSRLKTELRKPVVQKGAKLQEIDSVKRRKKNGRETHPYSEPSSSVSVRRLGGRVFERRVTEIGGKNVTVELGNKHLHGVDLIVRPGAIIHESMPLQEEEEEIPLERVKLGKRESHLRICSAQRSQSKSPVTVRYEFYMM
ncbi:unnamed protein product [Heligmosomoides polygyrus]|uniref:DNA-directed RNA polymerase n=1 Tax=Heligmosomoides polygyrus TaxID=6339 RepID=A0A183GVC2_HELPZ|nr:unnamed protein product [Heligmosomoides polygyrus]